MFETFDLTLICRDESCDCEEIHLVHDVIPAKKDPKPRSTREPWMLPAPEALDEAIVRAVSDIRPKPFTTIANDVVNDFGSLGENAKSGERKLHRRIKALVNQGRILRIDIGNTLFAYLRPSSRIADDLDYIREVIADCITEDSGRRTELAFG